MGVKPLHYYQDRDLLIFGSELKALIKNPLVPRSVSLDALNKYLSFEYVPAPLTLLEGVYKLEPGHMLIWEKGESTVRQYWDLSINQSDSIAMSEKECVNQFEKVFDNAVERRLMSDVDVGVFLSGGLDSSLVAAAAQRHYGKPMKAFNIGFEDSSFDEAPYAKKVADFAGLDFYSETLNEAKLLEVADHLSDIMDEPLADPSLIPTYLLSRLASQQVKVVLSGDGGDDILAGYVVYPALKLIKIYQALPTGLRHAINQAIAKMPVKHSYLSLDFKLKRFMRGAGYSSEIMFCLWMGSFDDKEKSQLLLPAAQKRLLGSDTYEEVIKYISKSRLTRDLERILYMMIKMYLQDDILVKVDRASMASSLEVRSPFLDYELVEFVNSLPSNLKIKRLKTKYILKKLGERSLPKDIVYRKKKGFGIPVGKWFRGDLRGALGDYLAIDRIKREGFFDADYVQRLMNDHVNGVANNYKTLWTLFMFEMWHERWLN